MKVIVFSCGRLHPSKARVFFDTTCTKLDLAHVFFFFFYSSLCEIELWARSVKKYITQQVRKVDYSHTSPGCRPSIVRATKKTSMGSTYMHTRCAYYFSKRERKSIFNAYVAYVECGFLAFWICCVQSAYFANWVLKSSALHTVS